MVAGWQAKRLRGAMLQAGKSVRNEFDKRAILRNHPIFGGLRPDLLERLTAHAVRRSIGSGTTIFARGDAGTCLFAILSGTIRISAPSPGGRSAIFNLLSEKAIFGEIALLDGLPRTADATAITDCELMVIERRDFVPLLREQPDIALKVIEVLCGRLRHTTEQLEDVMFLDLPGRLAKTLLQLAKASRPTPHGRKIALTQDHVAKIVGTSRESTNKQLREWETRNWLALERGGIVILAPEALAKVAPPPEDE